VYQQALKRPAIYISGVVEAAGAVLVFFKEAEAAWLLIGLMVYALLLYFVSKVF